MFTWPEIAIAAVVLNVAQMFFWPLLIWKILTKKEQRWKR